MEKFKLSLLIVLIFLTASCGGSDETEADKKFGKLEVEIPESLKDKPEVCKYIKEMNVVVDDYAMVFDEMIDEVGEYKGMKEEDLGTLDKIKLGKEAAKFSVASLKALSKWGECKQKLDGFEKDLNPDEVEALNVVYKRMDKRMAQIQDRHKDFFGDSADNQSDSTAANSDDLSTALSALSGFVNEASGNGKDSSSGSTDALTNQILSSLGLDENSEDSSDEVNPLKSLVAMEKALNDTGFINDAPKPNMPKIEDFDFDKLEASNYKMQDLLKTVKSITKLEKTYTFDKEHFILMPLMKREDRTIKMSFASDVSKDGDKYTQVFTRYDIKKSKNIKAKGKGVELGKVYPYVTVKEELLKKLNEIDKNAVFKKDDKFTNGGETFTAYIAQTTIDNEMCDFCVLFKGDRLAAIIYYPQELSHEENMKGYATRYDFSGSGDNLKIKMLRMSGVQKSSNTPSLGNTTMEYKY